MLTVEIVGNLGLDAEIKEFGGKKYTTFSLAHTENMRTAEGKTISKTTWVSVLWYGEGYGILPYLTKGAKVFIRDRLSAKVVNDKNGYPFAALTANATEVYLCGSRQSEQTDSDPKTGTEAGKLPGNFQNSVGNFGDRLGNFQDSGKLTPEMPDDLPF